MSKLILGSSNADYHSNISHLSSSSLKVLLKSAQQFHQEYILGLKEQVEKDVFVEGSLTHALILEPNTILNTYAVFPGLRRAGTAFEEFKANNKTKTIITAAQMLRCQRWSQTCLSMPIAAALLEGTLPEFNMISEILGVPVKARADAISISRNCIIDVKTTSMPGDADIFRQTVIDYSYHLSAALYCQIAYNIYGTLQDFYWIVISKLDNSVHVYKASTETLSAGSALVTQALVKYKKCLSSEIWQDEQTKVLYDTADYEIIEI